MAALLLDENVPRSAGLLLAEAGHDVAFVADTNRAADDCAVLAMACAGQRVLVTFDADFGDLVYQQDVAAPSAIIYLRLHPIDGGSAAQMVLHALAEPVAGQFVVCTPLGRRRRPLPSTDAAGR